MIGGRSPGTNRADRGAFWTFAIQQSKLTSFV